MKYLAKTFYNLESLLQNELKNLGAKNLNPTKRGVWFEGDKKLLYSANLNLRTALRILVPIYEFTAYDDRRLYKKANEFNWTDYLSLDKTFAIDTVSKSYRFKNSQFITHRIKDAIVDQFTEKFGKRPNIDSKDPDVLINVHLNNAKFTISLDSSGDTLNKRGYREEGHPASLNEVQAAGLILHTGWKGECDLVDFFCGSGTFLFEAALIASKTPPGYFRNFAFMDWKDFDEELWNNIKEESSKKIKELDCNLIGYDISEKAIQVAKKSLRKININKIKFLRDSFENSIKTNDNGIIISNPPYGLRLEEDNINELYRKVGSKLKHSFSDWDAWIFTGNMNALKNIGLKSAEKNIFFNGDIECRFNKYELYKGTK
jgi:putative N6-adenine-specific DNA methylase